MFNQALAENFAKHVNNILVSVANYIFSKRDFLVLENWPCQLSTYSLWARLSVDPTYEEVPNDVSSL